MSRSDGDIDYACESRIMPPAASEFMRVMHPVEPVQVRLGLRYTFGGEK